MKSPHADALAHKVRRNVNGTVIVAGTHAPMFSIVIPTFNVEKYIARCLDSCIAQEDGDFELVIVDDCGHDQSIVIAERYAVRDGRIRVVRHDRNRGTFATRRTGVDASRGSYVIFLDPDDALQPHALSTIRRLSTVEPADIIVVGVQTIPPRRWWTTRSSLRLANGRYSREVARLAFLSNKNFALGTPGKIYARPLLEDAYRLMPFVDDHFVYAEDAVLFFACACLAQSMYVHAEQLYDYHRNTESITSAEIVRESDRRATNLNRAITYIAEVARKFHSPDTRRASEAIQARLRAEQLFHDRHENINAGACGRYWKTMLNCYQLHRNHRYLTRAAICAVTLGRVRL